MQHRRGLQVGKCGRRIRACMPGARRAGCSPGPPASTPARLREFATPSSARRRGRAMAQPNDLVWGPGAQGWESALVRRAPTTEHARRRAVCARSGEKRALPSDPCSPRNPRRVAFGTETPRAQLSASLAWLEDGTGAATVVAARVNREPVPRSLAHQPVIPKVCYAVANNHRHSRTEPQRSLATASRMRLRQRRARVHHDAEAARRLARRVWEASVRLRARLVFSVPCLRLRESCRCPAFARTACGPRCLDEQLETRAARDATCACFGRGSFVGAAWVCGRVRPHAHVRCLTRSHPFAHAACATGGRLPGGAASGGHAAIPAALQAVRAALARGGGAVARRTLALLPGAHAAVHSFAPWHCAPTC